MGRHLLSRLLVGPLLVLLWGGGMVIAAAPVAAHTVLRSSDPADGAELSRPPESIGLDFSGDVLAEFATVTVTGPAGTRYEQGKPEIEGGHVRQEVKKLDAPGKYDVAFRVVSGDGHPVSGRVSFTLAAPASATSDRPTSGGDMSGGDASSGDTSEHATVPRTVASSQQPAVPGAAPAPPERPLGSEVDLALAGASPAGAATRARTLMVVTIAAAALLGLTVVLVRRRRPKTHEAGVDSPGDASAVVVGVGSPEVREAAGVDG